MSRRMRDLLTEGLGELRYEPIGKRIRAVLDGRTVVDTRRAVLVWEPRRIVPSYAVPAGDLSAELLPAGTAGTDAADGAGARMPDLFARPVLDPSVPFTVHSAEGREADLRAGGHERRGAGFHPADPALDGFVVLDFRAFDAWYEEDERNVAHPRDPFHRIDVLAASRHVRVELDGEVLAESSRPTLLFETLLPTRYYLPPEDVLAELAPSSARTWCAYKGQASYWSASAGDRVLPDIGWSYQQPLHDAVHIRGLIAFFNERLDIVVDGERAERPLTPWSPRPDA
ncbi:hypothetical protein DN069_19050 [Streptacidiphilus pinicola]|uniref:DUF427 domain-containing protein n=1 Tax=Streptacidiphilus pinicola TaxID=2219663 RepID=A0A2X0IHG6_9ACTN|nr:DUF427 domain-containing protein [Streptacidiphilus pinicola]RAG84007.1 hypothetical protein DN069_19050 [Streptacidiphilus pinicola]